MHGLYELWGKVTATGEDLRRRGKHVRQSLTQSEINRGVISPIKLFEKSGRETKVMAKISRKSQQNALRATMRTLQHS